MPKFCGKCGSKLDDRTGLCPNCNKDELQKTILTESKQSLEHQEDNTAQDIPIQQEKSLTAKQKRDKKKAEKRARKEQIKANRTFGQKLKRFFIKLFVILLVLLILVGSAICVLVYYDLIKVQTINNILTFAGIKELSYSQEILRPEDDYKELYEVTPPDADSYYKDNSRIVSEVDVNNSDNVTTEKDTCVLLNARGFSEYPITTDYSMDGEYSNSNVISDSSTTKHPIYQTFFVSKNGYVWNVFVIDGKVYANPVTYNLQSDFNVQVILSESDSVTSYDSTTNKYYETVPNKNTLIVKKVDQINAKTLESLTVERINNL